MKFWFRWWKETIEFISEPWFPREYHEYREQILSIEVICHKIGLESLFYYKSFIQLPRNSYLTSKLWLTHKCEENLCYSFEIFENENILDAGQGIVRMKQEGIKSCSCTHLSDKFCWNSFEIVQKEPMLQIKC